jgi:hypothetical protein
MRSILAQAVVIAGLVGLSAVGCGAARPARLGVPAGLHVPEGDYRVCHLVLESGLPGEERGTTRPLRVLAVFRGDRAVYAYARADATWPRYRHACDKWVEMD